MSPHHFPSSRCLIDWLTRLVCVRILVERWGRLLLDMKDFLLHPYIQECHLFAVRSVVHSSLETSVVQVLIWHRQLLFLPPATSSRTKPPSCVVICMLSATCVQMFVIFDITLEASCPRTPSPLVVHHTLTRPTHPPAASFLCMARSN